MIRYEQIDVSAPSELGSLKITPEGVALGGIPGWVAFVDPAYPAPDGTGFRNRALPNNFLVNSAGYSDLAFANGEKAFASLSNAHATATPTSFDLDPSEFSFFAVLQKTQDTITTSSYVIRPVVTAGEGEVGLYVFSTSQGSVALNSNLPAPPYVYRMSLPNVLVSDGGSDAVLVMFTFSTERGLTGYVNGEEVARSEDDKRPLSPGFFEEGQFRLHQQSPNSPPLVYGSQGFFNSDLSRPELAASRVKLEKFFKNKYGIL